LQAKLDVFTNPEVAVKDVEKEVFKVKSWYEKNTLEEGKKRKLEFNKEVDEIAVLRDAPPSKILKITPTQHPKPPSPGIPSREHTSPKSSMTPESPKKNCFKTRAKQITSSTTGSSSFSSCQPQQTTRS